MSDMNEVNATLIAGVIGAVSAIAAVFIGWLGGLFSRSIEERYSGAKLVIDCPPDGSKDITENAVYMKVRLRNDRLRLAKSCRVYLVELHEMREGKIIRGNKISDSFQLPWAGYDYDARDVPYKVSQFVDIMTFGKEPPESWTFRTKPKFYQSLVTALSNYDGTYQFTILAAADGAQPVTAKVCVYYTKDWHQCRIWIP
jgi:hypothetical protein